MVHWYANRQDTDTKTCDNATNCHVYPSGHRGDLDDVANNEYGHTNGQIASTTEPISSVGTSKCADEGTDGHEGNEQGLNRGVESLLAIALVLSESLNEILKDEHSRNLTLS